VRDYLQEITAGVIESTFIAGGEAKSRMLKIVAISELAFPNAYVETDNPPSHAFRDKIVALMAILGMGYFGLTVLVLHFLPTGYDPVRQFVTDYAVGQYALEMELGFFAFGAGVAALAIAIALANDSRIQRFGASMLFFTGVCLFLVGLFPTDVEGAAVTLHGEIHFVLSSVVFILTPISILLVSYGKGRRWFVTALSSLILAGIIVPVTVTPTLGAGGLVERIFVLVLLVWQLGFSVDLYRNF
jgi:hypothetical membrane protein